jgi:hypothetical protein
VRRNSTVRRLSVALLCLILVPLLTGCYYAAGSGQVETRAFEIEDFNRVSVGSAFQADVSYGEAYQVSVTADANLFNYLDVVQRGNTLYIGLKPRIALRHGTLQAVVTLPYLEGIDASGASSVTVAGFTDAPRFDVEASGASRLTLDTLTLGNSKFDISGASQVELLDLRADDADFEVSGASRVNGRLLMRNGDLDVSGASQVNLRGSAGILKIEGSGASNLNLDGFPMADLDLSLSGASRGSVDISGRLDLDISGASTLYYAGSPKLGRVEVTGASTLVQR